MTVYKDCKNCGVEHDIKEFAADPKSKILRESCRSSIRSLASIKGAETRSNKPKQVKVAIKKNLFTRAWV